MTYNVFSGTLNPTQSINRKNFMNIVGEMYVRVCCIENMASFPSHIYDRCRPGVVSVIMVALSNRADHYIFILFLLSSFFFLA